MKKIVARLLVLLFLSLSVPAFSSASSRTYQPPNAKKQAKLQKKQMKKLAKMQKKQQKEQLRAQKKANKQLEKRRQQGYAF